MQGKVTKTVSVAHLCMHVESTTMRLYIRRDTPEQVQSRFGLVVKRQAGKWTLSLRLCPAMADITLVPIFLREAHRAFN